MYRCFTRCILFFFKLFLDDQKQFEITALLNSFFQQKNNMKKILFLSMAVFLSWYTHAQSIAFADVVAAKWPMNDSLLNLDFYITNNPSGVKYKIKVTDLFTGSATAGKDYEFTTIDLSDITGKGTFTISVKPNAENRNRTININIKAVSDDTVFSAEMQIVLTPTPGKVKPIDKTNTPKFEFVNYTDFKGFDPGQPNGTAQSQFLFKLPINKHYRQWKNGTTKGQWFRSVILPNFIFNRIDKTDQPTSLAPTYANYGDSAVVSPVINTFDFIRSSNFILNPKLSVYTILGEKSRFQVQLVGALYKIKVDSATITKSILQDSVLTSLDTTTALNPVWAGSYGAELFYETHFNAAEFPFNFRFIAGIQFIRTRSGEYQQANVASTAPDNSRKTAILLGKTQAYSAPIWYFSATIKKNLGLKKDDSKEDHYLFFRFNYSYQSFKGNVLLSKSPVRYESRKLTNNFSQFQLGLDLNFDSFFK